MNVNGLTNELVAVFQIVLMAVVVAPVVKCPCSEYYLNILDMLVACQPFDFAFVFADYNYSDVAYAAAENR